MGFTIELVRYAPAQAKAAKAGRKRHREEVLDLLIEDGEIARLVDRQGRDRLPTTARLDPYADHVFDAYWCELLLADLDRVDAGDLTPSEATVLETLGAWARRCVAAPEGDHRIRFTGD
ncbi:hypothetical protein C3489_26815 [Streptomyces sp. Ru71]|uniref:hypothetical protein n=1 Tax=Streptomyces sp. Ru71 TaxID=2080746 RepID=UPI000CDDFDF4|nr:hypothetical protein [Streptomyces sp. Ru71]POX48612.1 hypothetical protein C3489_26815 [Streptomyces sp. Ru71]